MGFVNDFIKKTEPLATEDFLVSVFDQFKTSVVFASALGPEDQALAHMSLAINPDLEIITLDTGRLFQETYDLLEESRRFFGKQIRLVFPDAGEVSEMVNGKGPNLFYYSRENRMECCRIRKVNPLGKVLKFYRAWMTGLRKSQSPNRERLERVMYDDENGLVKINPIADWSRDEVQAYIEANAIPVNRLHGKGFRSIGCAPCTRAVKTGEDERAGRWWWEDGGPKECGIHG